MKLDWISIAIIKEFYNLKAKEVVGIADMRDRIFPKISSKAEKRDKIGTIRDKLQGMPEDIFDIKKEGSKWRYNLRTDNVCFDKFKFPEGKRDGVALKINSKWQINEL